MSDTLGSYRESGFAGELGPGRNPAVLVVDIVAAYLVDGSPLRAPVEAAVEAAAQLVSVARSAGVPVVFTRVSYQPGGTDGGLFTTKIPALTVFEEGSELGEFPVDPRPIVGETVVTKQYASAFFGTSLAATLTARGIDTLYICGLTTSGCIRASATDALQHGFRPLVVADACGDREPGMHESNLLDLQAKYADVIDLAQAIGQFGSSSG
ncbi:MULTISPECIES: isochorismatase family protein [unclassified Rhodococcus (in: high G+C Gram-positive bacteria)]|uniref:isochorismatase family protein n=1 Tax=unclassified Rhodococcus (in: high G+C Gram-positive bacteria) TaxID=192944 RepID=UPI000B9A6A2F|nr:MULTISPECIES: isochorismatase family protein [unclassified Rhodococcus (in: high G+C Gram-positive bacteria)]OZE43140.1 isochorismatase [Rhodococcus sp. 05-2254-4]OZE47326.1 isochorismatase [Rhodococcus sp. 05-2254-3]OZE47625.1 isochorismatase [Rhodococcus sp. 05-2254-2]